ncbi:nucleotidyltransferase domain-containing protein [Pannus brasiliensis CCIBt3594]|uniref:Nucleotidyltransferase domain-containing protein n=1 Tax=Pannus brasiliensis CCIBt3594 TaxID=1427578 RepID=A0AAW9QMV5_9CHRO
MSSFSTSDLDEIIADRRERRERERQFLLERAKQWLDEFSDEYGIETAYLFGSVTRPYRFHDDSDVDLAVEQIDMEGYFTAISELSTYLERDVDIIQLDRCFFADRIRQTGILWTKTPSPS